MEQPKRGYGWPMHNSPIDSDVADGANHSFDDGIIDHDTICRWSQNVIQPRLPEPRGPVSEAIVEHLYRPPGSLFAIPSTHDHPLWGEDSALAIHVLYALHYRGFAGVDEAWEWDPGVMAACRALEYRLEAILLEIARENVAGPIGASQAIAGLHQLASDGRGPSLSAHMEAAGTLDEMREFAVHRSIYQLKEADGHTWGIPRLMGEAKAALVEIQNGEYGNGDPNRVHAELFRQTMTQLGLDGRFGVYLDAVPAVTLATDNVLTFFGLHRRWRGALVGHLAHFEMCSVAPMTRYGNALRRLGFPPSATLFFDEHVVADEHHAVVAVENMVGGLLRAEPDLASQVLLGATTLAVVEAAFTDHLLESWATGWSSLRRSIDVIGLP